MDIVTYALLRKQIKNEISSVQSGFDHAEQIPGSPNKIRIYFKDNSNVDVTFPGIEDASIGNDGHLYIECSDSNVGVIDCGLVKGEKGEKGDKGDQGIKGDKGTDGKDGYSVTYKSHSHDDSNKITKLILHDEKTDSDIEIDLPDGENGKDGIDGKDGINGKDGKDGADGKDGKSISVKGTPVHDDINKKTIVILTDGTTDTTLEIPDGAKGDSGSGAGDMLASEYDATGVVKTAGGITSYVSANYVVKETGKGLSTNDYDAVAKTKVDAAATSIKLNDTTTLSAVNGIIDLSGQSIGAGGEKNKIESISLDGNALTIDANKNVEIKLDDKYVKQESGKGLSTKDYTAADQAKVALIKNSGSDKEFLAGDGTYKTITSGDTNVIEAIKQNGVALTVTNKAVDITVPTKISELTNDSSFLKNTDVDGTTIKYENGKLVSIGGTGTVKSVKANGTTHNPDANGLVDLGTIAGGDITDVKIKDDTGIKSVVNNKVATIDLTSYATTTYVNGEIDDIYKDTQTFVFQNDAAYKDLKNTIKKDQGVDKFLAGDGTYRSVNSTNVVKDVLVNDGVNTATIVDQSTMKATIDLSNYIKKTSIENVIDDTNKSATDKIASIKAIADFFDSKSKFGNADPTTTKVGALNAGSVLDDYTWQEIIGKMVYGLMNAPTIDSSMINPATIDKNTRTITFTIGTPTTAYTISNPDISKIKLNDSAITSTTISGNTVTIKYNSNLLNGNNIISFEAGTFNAIGDEVIYTGTTPNDAFNVSVNVSLNSVPTPAVNTSVYSNDTFTATFNLKDLIGGTATIFDASKISIENNAAAIDGTPILNGNTLTVKLKSKDSNRLNGIYKIIVAQGAIKNTGDNIDYINETKQNESFSLDCNHTLSILPTANLTVKNIDKNVMTVGITFGQGEMLINNYAKLNTHQDKVSITGLTSSQYTVSSVSSYEFTITVDPNATAGDYPVTIGAGAVTVDELGTAGRKYDRTQTSSNAVSNPGTITITGQVANNPWNDPNIEDYEEWTYQGSHPKFFSNVLNKYYDPINDNNPKLRDPITDELTGKVHLYVIGAIGDPDQKYDLDATFIAHDEELVMGIKSKVSKDAVIMEDTSWYDTSYDGDVEINNLNPDGYVTQMRYAIVVFK